MSCYFIYRLFPVTTSKYIKLKHFNRFFLASYSSISKNEAQSHLKTGPTAYRKSDATEERVAKCSELKAPSYPHKFPVFKSLPEFIECYEYLSAGEILKDVSIRVTGGIHDSLKEMFYNLHGEGVKIMVDSMQCTSKKEVFKFACGDTVECIGHPARTKEGDLYILPTSMKILTPCQRTLSEPDWNPPKFGDITRHLEMFLDEMGFELDYGIPNPSWDKYKVTDDYSLLTDPNALGLNSFDFGHRDFFKYMLKNSYKRSYIFEDINKYDVTGVSRDLEICDFYMCNIDSNVLMLFFEGLISGIVQAFRGSFNITDSFEGKSYEIDFTPPFKRIELLPELESAVGEKLPDSEYFMTPETKKKLLDLCIRYKLECPPPRTTPRLLDKLVEYFLGEKLINPTFLCNHPIIKSPFAKYCNTIPGIAKRFEMFSMKKKIAIAYTLFNNPKVHLEKLKALDKSDESAQCIDEICTIVQQNDFAPIAGCTMNIYNLAVLLRNSNNIKA